MNQQKKLFSAFEEYLKSSGILINSIATNTDTNFYDKDYLIKHHSVIGQQEMSIISTFYNEEKNVIPFYLECQRLTRIFNIKEMIFVQNGSADNTQALLEQLAAIDNRVKMVVVKQNLGYGFGFKNGLKASKTDLVLLNHSDCQFDAYAFFTQHFTTLIKFEPAYDVILSVRCGRTRYARLRSSILRWLAFIFLKQAAKEFNGQPKLFLKSRIGSIDNLPNDFGFDIGITYRLLKQSHHTYFLSNLELPRFDGHSSWSFSLSGQLKLMLAYISSIFKFRKCRDL